MPYLDIFTPLQESAIWIEAAANDGSTQTQLVMYSAGYKVGLFAVLFNRTLSGAVQSVMF